MYRLRVMNISWLRTEATRLKPLTSSSTGVFDSCLAFLRIRSASRNQATR